MNTMIGGATWMEIKEALPPWFLPGAIFILGAVVGSFLNVCIHRLPRGDSIVAPRSRCYSCGSMIHWFDNIPLVSYLLLKGKCRDCGARFSIRYWIVEWLTAALFLYTWKQFPTWEAVAYLVFICGLIAATFIDFEHYIIPDEITLGGIVVGLICSGLIPALQNQTLHVMAALWSLAGALAGYGALWIVVELGKRIFGVKKVVLSNPTEVFLTAEGIQIESEIELWENIFSRETDVLKFSAAEVCLGDKKWEKAEIQVNWQEIKVDSEILTLSGTDKLRAITQAIYIPREAMGFGDVKFVAAMGAFLGPKAVFFVILVSSLIGSAVGLTMIVIGKKEWGWKLPYGPYLAVAAVIWLFWGEKCVSYYLQWIGR